MNSYGIIFVLEKGMSMFAVDIVGHHLSPHKSKLFHNSSNFLVMTGQVSDSNSVI